MRWLGVALIIFQLTLYPSVERLCGPLTIARISAVSFRLNLATQHFKLHFNTACLILLFLVSFSVNAVATSVILTRFCYWCACHMQALSIPLLQSFPYIALFSGFTLCLVLNVASIAKSLLSVSVSSLVFFIQSNL